MKDFEAKYKTQNHLELVRDEVVTWTCQVVLGLRGGQCCRGFLGLSDPGRSDKWLRCM